ncbi:MAG TPA: DEAD/DEAH box helicase family protein [Terracidiphilus sp.]|nr:DEAD/DEAH box helicase family protein [Terracidiphilus sp.]
MSSRNPESESFERRDAENQRLREENLRLRRLLTAHGIAVPLSASEDDRLTQPQEPAAAETKEERARKRIALFRGLFRGREDVYARRWENPEGRHGYSPAALKDWKAINSSKPEDRKKVDKDTRRFLPLTDTVIEGHLLGKETVGIYPLLQDETCWFLAVDFDKKTWTDDSRAFLNTCRELNVPVALERSRSGNGAHAWIFFESALPATTARKLGCAILTRTMERRHQLGLDSYDRLFPNQDTMPKGGFGNLIALPLQFTPRRSGNSIFVDAELRPYPDQWEFLSSIRRLSGAATEEIVADAQSHGDLIGVRISVADDEDGQDPWTLPPSRKRLERPIEEPLPETVQIVRANLLYIEKQGLPSAMLNRLLRLAAFQNPEFYKAQAMRLPTFAKPRVIACGQDFLKYVAVPRGCLTDVLAILRAHRIQPQVCDERFTGTQIIAEFGAQLRPAQQEAAQEIAGHDEGILCAPTAFGKTAVAAWLIAARKVNTLILVHRQQLLDQWQERLAMFLGMPASSIGHIGGGKMNRTGRIDVAVIQSLYQKDDVKDFVAEYGQVIVDECHHISAFTFEQVMRQIKAKFVVGLTATPTRKDGHHPIIYMQCGPVRFSLSAKVMAQSNPFEHRVIPRHTDFQMPLSAGNATIQDVYAALSNDAMRNELIAHDVMRAVESGRTPLLLTGRTEHLQYFAVKLNVAVKHLFVLKGGMGKKQRRQIADAMAAVPDDEPRVILATGSYIGEGFDDARLDTLFLAMPISWKGTLQQYAGRLHRLHDNKRVVQVYDYVDNHVPMLARMYERRLKGYDVIGYSIEWPNLSAPLL